MDFATTLPQVSRAIAQEEMHNDGRMAKPLSLAQKASCRLRVKTVFAKSFENSADPSNSFSDAHQGRGKPGSSHRHPNSACLRAPPIYGQSADHPLTQRDTATPGRLSWNRKNPWTSTT
ncbi:hypothetical protein Nepgr_029836 [Nepenthes gracilis]|uniref:Uncharacterized protein n=1 Tax=Nepenthes gracilis TaxID=150966 RepID=A0AAD3TD95_NEPGR|nr:hypothetical protein Nepgr_029836 [Nepenthes gracilis]